MNLEKKKTIAIFDLDGTLTRRDTFVRFLLMGLLLDWGRMLHIPKLLWVFMLYKIGKIRDYEAKETFLFLIFSNIKKNDLALITHQLAQKVVVSGLRKNALSKILAHQKAGHRVLLASASLDVYVNPIADLLGISEVVATKCQRSNDGGLTGYLEGLNLKAINKLDAVKQLIREDLESFHTIAYSDHDSDLPLLRYVDFGIAVNPNSKLQSHAALFNLSIENWDV